MKKTLLYILTLFLLVLFTKSECYSQASAIDSSSINQTKSIVVKEKNEIVFFKNTKSPIGAIWRSFVLPGWGQYYVESYWKAPIFLAAAGTMTYFIIKNNKDYSDFQSQLDKIEDKNTTEWILARNKRENARDNRDMSVFYLVGVYALAAIDAYVGAHLYDFNVDDDFTVSISPNYHSGLTLNCSYSIYGK